jgi:hypothetical protein
LPNIFSVNKEKRILTKIQNAIFAVAEFENLKVKISKSGKRNSLAKIV